MCFFPDIDSFWRFLTIVKMDKSIGIVTVTIRSTGVTLRLPADDSERNEFIKAYERVCSEDVGYREMKSE